MTLATLAHSLRTHLSLMHGWIPVTVQVVAAIALVAAIGWRTRRWRLVWLPWAALCGVALTAATYWYIASQGLAGNPAPRSLWVWIGLSGAACACAGRGLAQERVGGAAASRWLALPLCLLCAGAGAEPVGRLLPHRADRVESADRGPAARPDRPGDRRCDAAAARKSRPKGTVVPVNIGDTASGFKHRGELVYLPPAWYATDPPPPLPTVMMIGGEFNTPADWLRAGNAVEDGRRLRRRARRQRPGAGVRRRRRRVQQRHRMRQRQPRQRRRPPHQRCCAVHGLELRGECRAARTGASSAGRWAAPAPSTWP